MTDTAQQPHIRITPNPNRVRVMFAGHLIADTAHALTLSEGRYPPVQYIPRADVEMAVLGKTARTSHCPHKGDASYYTLARDGRIAENAVWSYEAPLPQADAIRDHLAFYPQHVELYELPLAEAAPKPPGD